MNIATMHDQMIRAQERADLYDALGFTVAAAAAEATARAIATELAELSRR
jgi:hypothetical protein